MRWIGSVLFIMLSYVVSAQRPFIKDLSLNEVTGVKVNGLAQDATGYIWIATDMGVIRYNGRSFVKITDSVHLPATAISVSGKDIWVGYNNGTIGTVENLFVRPVRIYHGPSSPITSLFSG